MSMFSWVAVKTARSYFLHVLSPVRNMTVEIRCNTAYVKTERMLCSLQALVLVLYKMSQDTLLTICAGWQMV